jgi:ABC-2 type transport system permease protein
VRQFNDAAGQRVFVVAHFCRDRYVAFQLLMFVSVPLVVTSGFAWPFSQIPTYIQVIAALFPATPALLAFRVLATKSGQLLVLWPYLLWLAAQFTVYFPISLLVIRRFPYRPREN